MKDNKPENPSAFPDPMRGAEQSFINQTPHNHPQGMSLRDYFAAKAMQGMLASGTNWIEFKNDDVKFAYEMADAMLKQRNQ